MLRVGIGLKSHAPWIECDRAVFQADETGNMRMAAQHGAAGHAEAGLNCVAGRDTDAGDGNVLQQVLHILLRRTMTKKYVLCNHCGRRKLAQPGLMIARELLQGGMIGEPQAARRMLHQLPVMIAPNVEPPALREQKTGSQRSLQRARKVITQIDHQVRRVQTQIRQHGFQSQQIPVDVGDYGDPHGR